MGVFPLLTTTTMPALRPNQPPIYGYWGFFPGVKRQEHEADHSPPSSAGSRMRGAILPLPQHVFIAQCLLSKDIFMAWKFSPGYPSTILIGHDNCLHHPSRLTMRGLCITSAVNSCFKYVMVKVHCPYAF
jgi:hypothetical protein